MSKLNNSSSHQCNSSSKKINSKMQSCNVKCNQFDRPGITSIFKSRDPRLQKRYKENAVAVISKREFVEKWLFNYNDNGNTDSGTSVESVVNSPSPKRAPLSPLKGFKSKKLCYTNESYIKSRLVKSPVVLKSNEFHEETKNFLPPLEVEKLSANLESPNERLNFTKKNTLGNKTINQEDVDACKKAFFGSPNQALTTNYFKPISPSKKPLKNDFLVKFKKIDENMIIDENFEATESNENDSESLPVVELLNSLSPSPCFPDTSQSIDCDSPVPIEIQSLASSQVANECIDCESSEVNELDHTIDSENDITLNETIEDTASVVNAMNNRDNENDYIDIDDNDNDINEINKSQVQSIAKTDSNLVISQESSGDSDSTFFTDAEEKAEVIEEDEGSEKSQEEQIKNRLVEVKEVRNRGEEKDVDKTLITEEECSQKISQDSSSTSLSVQESVNKTLTNNISIEVLPPSTTRKFERKIPTIVNAIVKRKGKPKKGSLAARLQTLITSQMSFLRIWRHKMNHQHLKSNDSCFVVKVEHSTFRYGRQYIVGKIIEDKFKLLDKIDLRTNCSNSGTSNESRNNLLLNGNITIIIAPEIVGKIKINETCNLNIYTPWEVIDVDNLTLSISQFTATVIREDANYDNINTNSTNHVNTKELVVQQFNCSCLMEKKLVQSCDIKFSDIKPSVMQYIFED